MYGLTSEYPPPLKQHQPPPSVMETDSVKSGLSEQSWRSNNHRNHSTSSHRNHRSHSHKTSRSSRSKNPEEGMAPFQTTVTMEESRPGHELIEVQILPQDDNWGENTTGLTGNTSEQSGSVEEVGLWSAEPQPGLASSCYRYLGLSLAVLLSTLAFLSPLFMLILPKIGFFPSLGASLSAAQKAELLSCGAECKGLVVSLCFKLAILAGGVWALFLRRSRATLPSIFMFRAVVLLLIFICCFTYWLFYVVQITEGARESATGEETLEYKSVVSYASTLTDTLLFIHYLAVILIEIRHLQPMFYVKIVRSPDGESRSYAMGEMSVQRAAIWILDRYYTEFPIYNPYLERLPVSKSRKPASSFKYYHVDNMSNTPTQGQSRGSLRESRRRDSSHNERFYEEHDYERRVKKRRARLITATEEAFTHIKRLHHDPTHYPEGTGGGGGAMDCREAAQAVFPSLARALQKYLRVTRQQPRHSVDSILRHLSLSLAHDLSPRAFLHPFLSPAPVLQDCKEGQKESQGWSLICEELLTRPVSPGLVFQLRQSDVSLLVTVQSLPHFNITEEVIHPLTNRFVIRLNSETSV